MQSQNLVVGQTVAVTAVAEGAANNPVNTAVGNAALTQDSNTSVAHRSNNSGNGLVEDITADAPGTTVFTLTGHQSDGTTPFSSQFQIVVTPPVIDEPVSYSFSFGTPTP